MIAEIGTVLKQLKQPSSRKPAAKKKGRPESVKCSGPLPDPEILLSDSDPGGLSGLASPGAKVAWARGMDAWQRIRARKATLLTLALLVSLAANAVTLSEERPELSHQELAWLKTIPQHSVRQKMEAPPFLCLLAENEPVALDVLERLLADDDAEVRGNAALAIAHLGPQGMRFRPRIQTLSRHDDAPSVRRAAAEALECLNGKTLPKPLK